MIFEVLVNLVESGLCLLFIKHTLSFKKAFAGRFWLWTVCLTVLITGLNNIPISVPMGALIHNVIIAVFVIAATEDSISQKLVCFGINTFVFTVSDILSAELMLLIFDNSIHYLMLPKTLMRYLACTVYLSLLSILYFFAIKLRKSMVLFSEWYRVLFLVVILVGTYTTTWLLGKRESYDAYSDRYLIIFIVLFLTFILLFLFFNMIYTGVLYYRNITLFHQSKQLELEKEQYHNLTDMVAYLRDWKHDIRQHHTVLKELLDSGKCHDAQNYLSEIDGELNATMFGTLSGNMMLDAILSSKIAIIEELGIDFEYSLFIPDKLPLENYLLVAMIGNMFDNAIEACKKVSSDPHIFFCIKPQRDMLLIILKNSSCGQYCFDKDGNLKSDKKEFGHGHGLHRIREIAENASGFCQMEPLQNMFLVTVALPLSLDATETMANDSDEMKGFYHDD